MEAFMKPITISGKLVDMKNKPLAGYKVSVWDKDKLSSDHLGVSYTDARGRFTVSIDESAFKDGDKECLPDVFFLVYSGERVVHSTESRPIKNAQGLSDVVISADIESGSHVTAENLPFYYMQGIVRHAGSSGVLPGLKVEAWDKDVEISDQLGVSITGPDGSFSIAFDANRFTDHPVDNLPDIFFRIYSGEKIIHSTESKPLKNTVNKRDIVLEVDPGIAGEAKIPRLSKNETLDIAGLSARTPKEISGLRPDLYARILERAAMKVKEAISAFFENGSSDLRRLVDSMELRGLDPGASIKEFMYASIENDGISPQTKNEGLSLLAVWNGPGTLDDVIRPDRPLADNPLVSEQLAHADVYRVAAFASIDDKTAQELVSRKVFISDIGPALVGKLVREKLVTQAQGEKLNLEANLYAFAGGNTKLVEAMRKTGGNAQIRSIADFASLDFEDWKSLVSKAGTEESEAGIEKRANTLKKQTALLCPNEVMRARSRKHEEALTGELMERFFEANSGIDFLGLNYSPAGNSYANLDFGNMKEPERAIVLENLKTNQRLYRLTKDPDDAFGMKKAGYTGGHGIARDGFHEFVAKTGISEEAALTYYVNALRDAVNVDLLFGNFMDIIMNPLAGSPFENTSEEIRSYLRRLGGYSDFFGGTSFCSCSHCRSIVGPVAYFVDLMDFIKVHVTDIHFPGAPAAQHVLSPRRRRPDLWEGLPLSCENTDTLVPYLLIVNEVLENFIARSLDSAMDLADRRSVESLVYGALAKRGASASIDGFSQPFNLPLAELNVLLGHFPMTRAAIAEKVLAYVPDTGSIIPQSRLGISSKEYELISRERGADADRGFLAALYGIRIPSSGSVPDTDVQEMLRATGISRLELEQSLGSYFVTANRTQRTETIEVMADGSLEPVSERIRGLTPAILDRMHRFVRLWRSLDWSIPELDMIVEHLHAATSTAPAARGNLFPEKIAALRETALSLAVGSADLCALIHEIPMSDSPSLFDSLFNLPGFVRDESEIWAGPGLRTDRTVSFRHPAYASDPREDGERGNLLHRLLAGLGTDDTGLYRLIQYLAGPLGMSTGGTEPGTFTLDIRSLSLLYRHAKLIKLFGLNAGELFFLIRICPGIADNYIAGIGDLLSLVEMRSWWKESGYTLDELAFVLGDGFAAERTGNESRSIALDTRTRIESERRLLFADTLFAVSGRITEEQSRAIVAANPLIIVPADLHAYRVSPAAGEPSTFGLVVPDSISAGLDRKNISRVTSALLIVMAEHLEPGSFPVAENALEGVAGLTSGESAGILSANPGVFAPATDGTGYRITTAAADNPASIGLPLPPALWAGLSAEERTELLSHLLESVARHTEPGSPDITDRLFVDVAGLDLDRSRGIIASLTAVFERIEIDTLYWLAPGFDQGTRVTVPADIPLSPKTAQQLLFAHHCPEIIANMLAFEFGIDSGKFEGLALLAGWDFRSAETGARLTRIVQGLESISGLVELISTLLRLKVWFKDPLFDSWALRFMARNSGGPESVFRIAIPAGYVSPSFDSVRNTESYRRLLGGENDSVTNLNAALLGYEFDGARPGFGASGLASAAVLLETDAGIVGSLNNTLLFPGSDELGRASNLALEAFTKLKEAVRLVRYLGIGGEALPLFVSNDFDELVQASGTMLTAIRTKYDTQDEWRKKIEPFEDAIRELKRDALTDYLIRSYRSAETADGRWFLDEHDLYNYFLIDTELEGCARTSRVVAGISSLQLYVQRCIMNLEQSELGDVHVKPSDIPGGHWEWRKNYRVWEANRKVFLYPENYIEPDLRDNKTELFTELESELLQQNIDGRTALDAYSRYMKGFEEIATLRIAGSYHDRSGNSDVLHLFGVTPSDPPRYFYRTVSNVHKAEEDSTRFRISYGAWRRLDLKIPVRQVSPVLYKGTLYVFWVETTTRPQSEMSGGSSRFTGYEHRMIVRFSSLRPDGSWAAPQGIKLLDSAFADGDGIVRDPLADPAELSAFRSLHSRITDIDAFIKTVTEVLKKDPDLINSPYPFPVLVGGVINPVVLRNREVRNLLVPKYSIDRRIHVEPVEGYGLSGDGWDRVYPAFDANGRLVLEGRNYQMSSAIDLIGLKSGIAVSPPPLVADRLLPENKRLVYAWGNLFFLIPDDLGLVRGYANATRIAFRNAATGVLRRLFISGTDPYISIINGSLTDAIFDFEGDLIYIYSLNHTEWRSYALKRLGTTLAGTMISRLFETGVDGLLDADYQESGLGEAPLPLAPEDDEVWNDAAALVGKMDTNGSLGVYFTEIFFHIPFLIANHLNSQSGYADAQKWYHYIFNPLSDRLPDLAGVTDPAERRKRMADRVWQFVEFRNHSMESWYERLNDSNAVAAYENDPFNPHAIARLRLGAYMKCIVMKYVDNLLDWGDSLFAQDTMESVNEATLLYVMAAEILGPRPVESGKCMDRAGSNPTFDDIYALMNGRACSRFLDEVEATIAHSTAERPSEAGTGALAIHKETATIEYAKKKADKFYAYMSMTGTGAAAPAAGSVSTTGGGFSAPGLSIEPGLLEGSGYLGMNWKDTFGKTIDLPSFHTSLLKQACLFCIPANPDLLAYWDRTGDRLYKIRNCMNLSGIRRKLPLFSPEIDPRLLVRARAAGISLEDALDSIHGDLPTYRFSFLLAKAKEYAGALQSFGMTLLGAIEKKSAEELSMLHLVHQDNVLKLTRKLRDMEVAAAEESLAGLLRRQDSIASRKRYYEELIAGGWSEWEVGQFATTIAAHALKVPALAFTAAAGIMSLPPSILGFSFSTPTEGLKNGLAFAANAVNLASEVSMIASNLMGTQAAFERREDGWKFSLEQTRLELLENERQIAAAEIRRDLSIESRNFLETSIDQQRETYEFYRDKFTGIGLYTWLSAQLQRMYRESYGSAMTVARMAERAYRFERNDDTSVLLDGSYWEPSRAGLLAGEKLSNSLRQLELRYMETNSRGMEIDQAFSLTQADPAALLALKARGACEFTIPELFFDLFYPGQYRRRIKSARLTIPCITGPYSNVGATLTLKSSMIRKDPVTGAGGLLAVNPSRSVTIATSSAQNDGGVFRLDFHDERYMPFEGAGAVESTWRLELPENIRPFDYATINDVILHISYTALYDTGLREEVEESNGRLESLLSNPDFFLQRVFSFRQEFSQTFHRLLHGPEGETIRMELSERHFPLFIQGKRLHIAEARVLIDADENGFRNDAGIAEIPDPLNLGIRILGNGAETTEIAQFEPDETTGLYYAVIGVSSFSDFMPATGPLAMTVQVTDAADLAPRERAPSDPSALDDHKVRDVLLLVKYRVAE